MNQESSFICLCLSFLCRPAEGTFCFTFEGLKTVCMPVATTGTQSTNYSGFSLNFTHEFMWDFPDFIVIVWFVVANEASSFCDAIT